MYPKERCPRVIIVPFRKCRTLKRYGTVRYDGRKLILYEYGLYVKLPSYEYRYEYSYHAMMRVEYNPQSAFPASGNCNLDLLGFLFIGKGFKYTRLMADAADRIYHINRPV